MSASKKVKDIVQINLGIERDWLEKLKLLAIKKSQDGDSTYCANDLIRTAIKEHFNIESLYMQVVVQ